MEKTGFEWYVRFCKRCGRKYKTKLRGSKFCGTCSTGFKYKSAEKRLVKE